MTESVSELIFHYTDQRGLLGILSTTKIWATAIECLGDGAEFELGLAVLQKELADLKNGLGAEDRSFFNEIPQTVQTLGKKCFVASFSDDGNSPYQWEHYGAKYLGFSIGFSKSKLLAWGRNYGFMMQECVYRRKDQEDIIKGLLNNALDEFHDARCTRVTPSFDVRRVAKQSASTFSIQFFLRDATRPKSDQFSPEKEWRIVHPMFHNDSSKVQSRTKGGSNIRYIEIQLPRTRRGISIEQIRIGRGRQKEPSRQLLEYLFSKHGVRCSDIQY